MAGFMIASPRSGSGKTMLVCGLIEAAKMRGLSPWSFKCGPDYIDGLFHRQVLGVDGGNLDSFFEEKNAMRAKYDRICREHFAITEGTMGYFDGLGGTTARASAWETASLLQIPVILAVDARGASLSLLALLKGFLEYERELGDSRICAVIFNRLSSAMYPRLKQLTEEQLGIRAAGYVPPLDFLTVGSRHLGLILPGEIPGLREQMGRLGDCLEETLDWDCLLAVSEVAAGERKQAGAAAPAERTEQGDAPAPAEGAEQADGTAQAEGLSPFRLGVAWDEAFCFYYRDNLELLKALGAELVYFSPLHDEELPLGLSGLLLGGGYPEQYAEKLSCGEPMRRSIAAAAEAGMPVLAECGGYIYLLEELEGMDGRSYPMAGVFSGRGRRKGKNSHFGYISLSCSGALPYLLPGEAVRGHEFHYWECQGGEAELAMTAQKPVGGRSWPAVRFKKQVMGGFPHLYYPSCPAFAHRFARACREYGAGSPADRKERQV